MLIKMLLRSVVIALLLVAPAAPLAAADLRIDIIHRDGPREPPPPVRVESSRPRHGYVWVAGYYTWRHGHYVWRSGHYARQRRGYDWTEGKWDRHDDHYDWHRGEWHPHR
jgi:hypothetical protein